MFWGVDRVISCRATRTPDQAERFYYQQPICAICQPVQCSGDNNVDNLFAKELQTMCSDDMADFVHKWQERQKRQRDLLQIFFDKIQSQRMNAKRSLCKLAAIWGVTHWGFQSELQELGVLLHCVGVCWLDINMHSVDLISAKLNAYCTRHEVLSSALC